ncbi:mitochondrial inner membrane protein Shh4p [Trichomonascus vanleenenianus]|uniref:CybS family protein n=1 Tax=Trichomonascus vanleenenianus TaxID=2268995 RepID=UPI003ECAFE76
MLRVQVRNTARIAAMAGRRTLFTVPQPPGGIVGTVNEATKTPKHDPVHGSYHWSFERILAVSIVPLTVAPFALQNGTLIPVLDATLGSLLVAHVHMGLQSCIIDYIPKRVYGKYHNVAIYALTAGSVVALYGLYQFETNDVGITESIQKIWKA